VRLQRKGRRGEGIHRRGSDLARGAVAVASGTRVTPAVIAVLAPVGEVRPRVVLPPRVAVAVTGDEIHPPGTRRLPPAAIRNSNGPTLEALVRRAGCVVVPLGAAPDQTRDLARLLRKGLKAADVVVFTGGVSAGDRDLLPAVLRAAGVRRVFHRIDLKPGKPAWFGVLGEGLVFGLPGNPVSAQVTFAVLVAPALAALAGDPHPGPRFEDGALEEAAPAEGPRTALRPARATRGRDGALRARLLPWNGSGDMVGFARANALVRRDAGAAAAAAGAKVPVLLLEGDR
jgi:molybdopterin molybdotransferase